MTIRQIEVNGTTYDVDVTGSILPMICETYVSGGSSNPTTALPEADFNSGKTVAYIEYTPSFLIKRTQLSSNPDTYKYEIVTAVESAYVDPLNEHYSEYWGSGESEEE